MKDVHILYLDGEHFNDRLSEKNVPAVAFDHIKEFNANEWTLKTAEVRTDKGKFVNSSWEFTYDNERYWITVGVGNYITTIVKKQVEV